MIIESGGEFYKKGKVSRKPNVGKQTRTENEFEGRNGGFCHDYRL
jgi:hypothetical protein